MFSGMEYFFYVWFFYRYVGVYVYVGGISIIIRCKKIVNFVMLNNDKVC